MIPSDEGRWLIIILKQDNTTFIVCNAYGYKTLFSHITSKLNELLDKYSESFVVTCGDFNECVDDVKDRFPAKIGINSQNNNLILKLCSDLSLKFNNSLLQDMNFNDSI